MSFLSKRSAWKAVESAVKERRPRPTVRSIANRRLLVVLPIEEEAQRAAWALLRDVDVPVSQLTLIVEGETVFYSPDLAAGRITRLEKGDLDRRGLPSNSFVSAIRGFDHDVSLLLAPEVTPASVILCAASPSPHRIAFFRNGFEDYFDLIIEAPGDYTGSVQVLRDVLEKLDPPVVPIRQAD